MIDRSRETPLGRRMVLRCRGGTLWCRRDWLAPRSEMIRVGLRWDDALGHLDLRPLSFGGVRTVWAFLTCLAGDEGALRRKGLRVEEVGWRVVEAGGYFCVEDLFWKEVCVWREPRRRRPGALEDFVCLPRASPRQLELERRMAEWYSFSGREGHIPSFIRPNVCYVLELGLFRLCERNHRPKKTPQRTDDCWTA